MGESISKPDANPILFALLNFFLFGGVGYLVMGQQKKGIITIVAVVILACTLIGGFLAPIIAIIAAVDAYKLGQKLQNGHTIGQNENGLEFLNAIFKD